MIENGMVVGADEAYAARFADDAWEDRDASEVLDFAMCEDIGPDVICWFLNAPHCDMDAAREIAEMFIPAKKYTELVEKYVSEKHLEHKFNEWKANGG